MEAWHGTHVRFESFSAEFVGSGRGDAPIGWGFYFSESRRLGEHYAHLASDARGTGFLYRVELAITESEIVQLGNEDAPLSRKFLWSQYNSRRQSAGSEVYAKMLRFANCHVVVANEDNDPSRDKSILCMSPERIRIREVLAFSNSPPHWVAA
jgi:hypothetical protein